MLVTGASGFLGGRFVERLVLANSNCEIRGLIHTYSHATRLGRLPVQIIKCDLASERSVSDSLRGAQVVVHCALGTKFETISGTRALVRASLSQGIKKFVHISSVAVHGYSAPPNTDENSPLPKTSDVYCRIKIESERLVQNAIRENNLPGIVLRPTNIFGPYSRPWTVRPISMLKRRDVVLIDGGNTPSNAVYVDNVVDAILLAITSESAVGHTFIIADTELMSWRDFFGSYARMFTPPLPVYSATRREAEEQTRRQFQSSIRHLLQGPKSSIGVLPSLVEQVDALGQIINFLNEYGMTKRVQALAALVPSSLKDHFLRGPESLRVIGDTVHKAPSSGMMDIFTSRAKFNPQKAESLLGYHPRYSFEYGMRVTQKWLEYSRLLEN